MTRRYESDSTMDPKLKARWVKALRSGKFIKATRALEKLDKDEKYKGNCCLGVLCRIEKIPGKKFTGMKITGLPNQVTLVEFAGKTGNLPTKLLNRFGLSNGDESTLIKLNDAKYYSFKKIADWIERNLGTQQPAGKKPLRKARAS